MHVYKARKSVWKFDAREQTDRQAGKLACRLAGRWEGKKAGISRWAEVRDTYTIIDVAASSSLHLRANLPIKVRYFTAKLK